MPRPTNHDSENLRPLPKPIKLDLPKDRPRQQRRLHEAENTHGDYDYTHIPQDAPPPRRRKAEPEPRQSGERYFSTAQKAYGQRRKKPRPPKEVPPPRRKNPGRPGLGQGDRLYTPPAPKKPLIPPQVSRVLKFWSLGIIAIAFIVLVLMSMFRNNAWAVYLDDRFMGYIPINREVEKDSVHNDAVNHLSASIGATIQVSEETIVREARTRRANIKAAPDMMILLSQGFSYKIEAAAIYINGEQIAVLRNRYEAQHVADELQRQFIIDEGHISADFDEDWRITATLADMDDLDEPSDIIQLLERPVRNVIQHTIRDGDTQGALALEFNTTLESIGYLNNITLDTILRPGNIMLIEVTQPRLTVRTINETSAIEDIPMETEILENPDWHISVSEERTSGQDGQREVVTRIIRINGHQLGQPEIVSTRVLREPVNRVVEQGTSETSIEVR